MNSRSRCLNSKKKLTEREQQDGERIYYEYRVLGWSREESKKLAGVEVVPV